MLVKLSSSQPLLSAENGCAYRLGFFCNWISNGLTGESQVRTKNVPVGKKIKLLSVCLHEDKSNSQMTESFSEETTGFERAVEDALLPVLE